MFPKNCFFQQIRNINKTYYIDVRDSLPKDNVYIYIYIGVTQNCYLLYTTCLVIKSVKPKSK